MSQSSRSGLSQAHRLLLGAFLALIPAAPAAAQDAQELFRTGMAHYHNGDHEQAIAAFRQLVAMEPDQASAYTLLNSSQDQLMQLMVAGGEFETFARNLMEDASATAREAVRDQDSIAEVAERCFDQDDRVRSKAIFELGYRHGAFGAAPLIEALSDQRESRRLMAIYALTRIGAEMTQPVLAASWSNNPQTRSGCAIVLSGLNDGRAAGRLADMAANDENGGVRMLAAEAAPAGDVSDMVMQQGWSYLNQDPEYGLASVENYGVFWVADGVGVQGRDMPPTLVSLELAKRHFLRALELGHADSGVALATTYALEISALHAEVAAGNDDLQTVADHQTAAVLTLPTEILAQALAAAVAEARTDAALILVDLVGARAGSEDALRATLENARAANLRYAAAMALAEMGDHSGSVAATLAEATNLEALRVVHLIDPDRNRAMGLAEGLAKAGVVVIHGADGADGLIHANRSVLVDAFVIADPLPDLYARRVVKEIRKIDRFADTPIMVLGNEDTGDIDDAEVAEDADAQTILDGFGDLGIDRERFLATAAKAAQSLAGMAWVDSSTTAGVADGMVAALGREDAVAIPSAYVIGVSGSGAAADALASLIADDGRSSEARTAAASALANLIARTGAGVSADGILAAMEEGDAALSAACARVLGAGGYGHLSAAIEIE